MKRFKALKIIGIILAGIVAFFLVINLIPPAKVVENNPFVVEKDGLPMVAAHRGGGECNPENTMLAFREAVNTYRVDIIESDLYLTADGYLVYNHDAYIDETCNVNGDLSLDEVKELCENDANRHYISDMTLVELEQYNFGYYFEKDGQRIYKDVTDVASAELQIATVDKLFAEFYETNPDLLFIVEIKNEGAQGLEACRVLSETLKAYPGYEDQIVVGTFHKEIEDELKSNYPHLMRGASEASAGDFVKSVLFGINLFDDSDFVCLQIPLTYDVGFDLPLTLKPILSRAHRRNMAVQYWTINDADEMRMLIDLGCDCIMTDNPELLQQVLNEYQ